MRDMMRSGWTQIREKDFLIRDGAYLGRKFRISLLFMRRVEPAVAVGKGENRVLIADAGYAWLQAAEDGGRIWMTAMYDRDGNFVQIYFDITRGNDLSDPENPKFEDLYLDLVVKTDGTLLELDREELDAALARGEVAKPECEAAVEAMERLKKHLAGHMEGFLAYCEGQYREFMKEWNDRQENA